MSPTATAEDSRAGAFATPGHPGAGRRAAVDARERSALLARVRGVYLLTPDEPDTARLLAATAEALAAGITVVQYRCKAADASTRQLQAEQLRRLTADAGALLIVNDDPALARACAADGVHLGRDDPWPRPRADVMSGMLLGASCYADLARAEAAIGEGADYVAFGSVFASLTKPTAVRAPLALLGAARARGWHTVAIGGIDRDNIARVAAQGAHAAALIAAVYGAADPRRAARELINAFEQGQQHYVEQHARQRHTEHAGPPHG